MLRHHAFLALFTVMLGETVTLAATRQAAKTFGNTLLDHYTTVTNRSVLLRLTGTRAAD